QTVLRDLALAWLKGDELEKYRGLCTEQLAKHARGVPLPEVANALAWLCVLDPGGREPLPKAHWERVVALAHSAQERDPDDDAYRTTLGAAYLRSGKAQEAIKFLRQADRELPANRFLLAMAYRQKGDDDAARKAYEEGAERLKARSRFPEEEFAHPHSFWDRVELEL